MNTRLVVEQIFNERAKQDAKWGVQNHNPFVWLGILMEEVGEAAKAALEGEGHHMCDELIHAAAVCVAMIECYFRNHGMDMQSETKKPKE